MEIDLASLEAELINFVTNSNRIFRVERLSTWKEFHSSSEKASHFRELGADDLREQFDNLAPRLFNLNLSESQLRIIKLLEINPEYKSVSNGFQRISPDQRLTISRQPKLNFDFAIIDADTKNEILDLTKASPATLPEFGKVPIKPRPSHTLITTEPMLMDSEALGPSTMSSAALLSCVLAKDSELMIAGQLSPEEMLQRMRKAKNDFNSYGVLPENAQDAKKLQTKVINLNKIKETLMDITSNYFLTRKNKY